MNDSQFADTIPPAALVPHDNETSVDVEFRGQFEAQVELLVEFGKAQAEFEALKKDTEGQSGHQRFKYMNFAVLRAAVVKPLAAHGIGFTQAFTSSRESAGSYMLLTSVVAGHGAMMICRQWWPTETGSPNAHDGQTRNVRDLGGLMTYYRRYAAQTLLVVEGDRDEDSNPEPTPYGRRETPPSSSGQKPKGRGGRPSHRDAAVDREQDYNGSPGEDKEPLPEKPRARTQEQNTRLKELFDMRYGAPEYSELSKEERAQMIKKDCYAWAKSVPNELTYDQAEAIIAKLCDITGGSNGS
jgi:hypothetical protein